MVRAMLAVLMLAGLASAQITTSLTGWTLGTTSPAVENGTLPDMSTGDYINVPVGTKPFYYEVGADGAGMVELWVHDAGNCLNLTGNNGLPARGPKWGLRNSGGVAVAVGIDRASYVSYCQGYSQWCSAAAFSPQWFQSGVRDSSYVGGWYKWQITAGTDDITFNYNDGQANKTYNATTNATWTGAFGTGFNAVYVTPDGSTGNEPINIHCTGGTGVFAGIDGGSPVSQGYTPSSWDNIKSLFR